MFSMKLTKNAATPFAAIVVLVSMIAFSSNSNLSLFADPGLPQHISASQAEKLSVAPLGKTGTFSPDRSLARALAPANLTGIGKNSESPLDGSGHGSGDETSGGPALPSFSAAANVLVDSFDRQNSPDVGNGWVETEVAGSSTVSIANNQLFFDKTSDGVNVPLVKKGFVEVSTGTVKMDFDFNFSRTGPEVDYRFLMQLGKGMTDTSQNGGAAINLVWTAIGGVDETLGYRDGSGDHGLEVVSGAKHISVVANLGTHTYTVQVGSGTVHAGIPFGANVPLNQVRFFTDGVNELRFTGRTIDELIIFSSDAPPPGNTPPVAQGQSVSTGKDTPRSVTLTATDPEQCQLNNFEIVTNPGHGSLSVLANQPCVSGSPNSDSATLVYTPTGGFTGSDSFTWWAGDGLAKTNIATVSITVGDTAAGLLLSDNFDRPDSFLLDQGWEEIEQDGASAEIAAKKLQFAITADLVNRPMAKRAFSQISNGTLRWDFDLDLTRSGNEGTYRFFMQLGNSTLMNINSQELGVGVNLIWTTIGGVHETLGYRDGSGDHGLEVVSGAKHISVVADLGTYTYTVRVGNGTLHAGIPFGANGPLNQVRFFSDALNHNNFSTRSIDNLTISSGSAGNLAPVAQGATVDTPVGTAIDLVLGYIDPDGPGPYKFTIVTPPNPLKGVLTGVDANRTYTPNSGFTGVDTFQWSVNDKLVESNVATTTVNVISGNVSPVAKDDFYSAFKDTTLNVGPITGVLANDDDANGNFLTAQKVTNPPGAKGVLTAFNTDGSFSFKPAVGFTGPVLFTYVAFDGTLASNTAIVTIDVAVGLNTLNLQPVNGQTNVSLKPTLEIDCAVGVTTAAQYQIATTSTFTTLVYDSGENINDTCSHLANAGLSPSTIYFWRGKIKDNQNGWSAFSQPTSFTTVNPTPIFANVFQGGTYSASTRSNSGYNGTGDADIRGFAPDPTQVIRDWNQGAQDVIRTGRRLSGQSTDEIERTLLKFDLGGLTNPNAVVNAYFELTGWFHTDSNHLFHQYNSMYELNKAWSEGNGLKDVDAKTGESSWTYTAKPNKWTIPGAASASDTNSSADRSETALVRQRSTNQEGLKSIWSSKNLVEAVKGWIRDPASNNGVLIKADDETSSNSHQTLHRASREAQDSQFHPCPGGACHPKLVIVSTEALQGQPNVAPVASNQSVSTGPGAAVGLLLAYTDSDGPSPYTFTILTGPSHGTLIPSGPGGANYTYTPTGGFTGLDSFTWQVKDGLNKLSNQATFSINITQTNTLLSDNFNRANSADVGPGWVETEGIGASAVIASNKLHFPVTSDATDLPLVKRSFTQVSAGTVHVEFKSDWTRLNDNEGTYRVMMQVGKNMPDTSQNVGTGINLFWANFNNVHQTLGYRDGSGDHALKVVSGPATISVAANLDTNRYSVAVNGTVIQSDIAFYSNVPLNQVRFFTNNVNHLNFSGRSFDDLTITTP